MIPWKPEGFPDELLEDWHKEPDLCKALGLAAPKLSGVGYLGYAALMTAAAAENARLRAENALLREGLTAAIRSATLALFVIRKQNVMPNRSWETGFESDLKKAIAARDEQ